jgi:DNA-binding CsgD family transcriptional regulator
VVTGAVSVPSESAFVRSLRRALVEDVRAEIELALRVNALAGRGYTNGQIAARLGASTAAVHVAVERLRRVRSTTSMPLPGVAVSALQRGSRAERRPHE